MLIKRKSCIYLSFFSLLVIILFLFFHLKTIYFLEINDLTNKKIYSYKLDNEYFSLGYTHSVMKTEIEEFFKVENENIKLVKTEYSSFGVGLPFLPEEGKLEIKNDKMILNINKNFKNINMAIFPIAKHYLRLNNKKYRLSEDILGDKPTKISITIKKKYRLKGGEL